MGLVAVLVVLAGCSTSTEIGTSGESAPASPAPAPSVESAPQVEPANVFADTKNSVVFIQTPDATGSGVVIDGGWIVTNAHVVERRAEARVGRSDGVDLGIFPVGAVDPTLDLALIGPIDDDALEPFARVSSADVSIGNRVFLSGFPDEASDAPTPTFTEGIVSRRRTMALGDYSFLQVDALIAPGQSGGALIDEAGNLVGISGLRFGSGGFGLAIEADSFWRRLDLLLNAEERLPLLSVPPVNAFTEEVGHYRYLGFVVDASDGKIEFDADSSGDLFVLIRSLGGEQPSALSGGTVDFFSIGREQENPYSVDEFGRGGESVEVEVEPDVYQVIVGVQEGVLERVEVTSERPMYPLADKEDERPVPIGEIVEGEFGWYSDSDRWVLEVEAGQSVTITLDAIADTFFSVRQGDEVIVSSDDEAIGLYGTGSRASFDVSETGELELEVASFDEAWTGYLLEVIVE